MDNFHFDMVAIGDATMLAAIALAMTRNKTATHWAIRPTAGGKPERMVFYWTAPGTKEANAFPFKASPDACADFAARWLAEVSYGAEPDHDGDDEKGWRIWNEDWGHVDGDWEAIFAIAPRWIMFGK